MHKIRINMFTNANVELAYKVETTFIKYQLSFKLKRNMTFFEN